MLPPNVLAALVCPESKQPLSPAEPALIEQLNQRIKEGTLVNRQGVLVSEPVEGGFLRKDSLVLYPIRGGIPILLSSEGIVVPNHHN